MIKSINTIVAQAAVRCARRPKDLASKAIFQLNRLTPHEDLFRPGRRSVGGTVECIWHLDLFLNIRCFVLWCPRNDAGIAKWCAQQWTHCENIQNAADDWNAQCDAFRQERAVEDEKQSACAGDEHNGEIKDARIGRRDQQTVAIEFISARKQLPLSHDSLSRCHLYSHLLNASLDDWRKSRVFLYLSLHVLSSTRVAFASSSCSQASLFSGYFGNIKSLSQLCSLVHDAGRRWRKIAKAILGSLSRDGKKLRTLNVPHVPIAEIVSLNNLPGKKSFFCSLPREWSDFFLFVAYGILVLISPSIICYYSFVCRFGTGPFVSRAWIWLCK